MAHPLQLARNVNAGYLLQVYVKHHACCLVENDAVQKIFDITKAGSVITTNTQATLYCAKHAHIVIQNHHKLAGVHIAFH